MSEKQVLVVKVKCASGVDELAAMREYVIESVRRGVLVLDAGMSHSIETMPDLGAVGPVVVRLRDDCLTETSAQATIPSLAEEKMSILTRLKAYRDANGVGCLNDLARKTRDKNVTADFLRLLLVGDVSASIATWRRISSALANLEPVPAESEAGAE